MTIPTFENKKDLFDFLIANKSDLIAAKKSAIKYTDIVSVGMPSIDSDNVTKAESAGKPETDTILAKIVLNTSNFFDSHKDVHFGDIWIKTLRENKNILHLQEHNQNFASIIASGNDLKAYTKTVSFKELGFNYSGKAVVLVFESTIRRERNPEMFKQYAGGYVNQHSVGMQYVKIEMAVNDEDYKEEFATWQKYYPEIANKSDVDKYGYFYAVTEAKLIEGSAVVFGSNPVTPTLSIESKTKIAELETEVSELKNKLTELQETLKPEQPTSKTEIHEPLSDSTLLLQELYNHIKN